MDVQINIDDGSFTNVAGKISPTLLCLINTWRLDDFSNRRVDKLFETDKPGSTFIRQERAYESLL